MSLTTGAYFSQNMFYKDSYAVPIPKILQIESAFISCTVPLKVTLYMLDMYIA
jgi:hypothetical protein